MKYEQFLEKTNAAVLAYEKARQELADKYSSDLEKLREQFEVEKEKDFNAYKEAKAIEDKEAMTKIEKEGEELRKKDKKSK
jgi:hypothetical protein